MTIKKLLTIILALFIASITLLAFAESGVNKPTVTNNLNPMQPPNSSIGNIETNTLSDDSSSDQSSGNTDNEIKQCQIIHWTANRVYTINGSINIGTHITLPEPAFQVVVGNSGLWTQEHTANHVFVKPNTDKKDGEITNITYIGESNASYEFVIKRVPDDQAMPCVVVTKTGSMVDYGAVSSFQNRDKEVIKYLATQFDQQKKQIISQQQSALDKYRSNIYTRYKVDTSSTWFGQKYVSDVYDDGRWTYIRVTDDNKGVMSIYGLLQNKKTLLQFSYDETTRVYRISGIYPRIIMAYGKETVTINRLTA